MASLLDLSNEREAHINERLQQDMVIWLNSVRPDGQPHAVVVWFLWDGENILIFSRPKNQKVLNLQQNSRVVLALDNTRDGADPVTIEGTAQLLSLGVIDVTQPTYVEKYGEGMKDIGFTPEKMAASFSQAILITPTRVL